MDCTDVEEGYKVRYTPLVPGDYFIAIKYNGYHIAGSPFRVPATGELLAEKGVQESSSVMVETVTKVSKKTAVGPVLPQFKSDASKVSSKGMGLKKAYLNKQNTFNITAGDAGTILSCLFLRFLLFYFNHTSKLAYLFRKRCIGFNIPQYKHIIINALLLLNFTGNNLLFVAVYGPKGPCDEVFMKHLGHNNYQVNYAARDRGDYVIVVKWGEDHIPGSPFKVDVL